jgi:hypothetical protein
MATLTTTIPTNTLASTPDRKHATDGTRVSDTETTRDNYRELSKLSFSGVTVEFDSLFPELAETRQKESITLHHRGSETTVNAYTGNIYFAAVPASQVINVPHANWPSPIVLAASYTLDDPSAEVTRIPVSDRGLVGWLMENGWPTTPVTVTDEEASIEDIPISLLKSDESLIEGRYCILIQQINTNGEEGTIKLIVEDAGGSDTDADVFISAPAYPSGIYPFNANGSFFSETDAEDMAALETCQLQGRIRTIPDYSTLVGWKERAGTEAPIAKLFPISEETPTSVQFRLAGWYFDAVDINGDAVVTVPQGIKCTVELEEFDDPDWVATSISQDIDTTDVNAARNITLSGLTANTTYRVKVTTAGKGNTLDGAGSGNEVMHREAADGDGYSDTNLEAAKTNLFQGSASVVSESGAVPLDTPQFILIEQFTSRNITYEISNNSDDSSKFDIAFTCENLTEVATLDITSGSNTYQETGDGSPSYVITFYGLTEDEIESTWTVLASYAEDFSIEFEYTIGANSIGALVQTADGVFEQRDTAVATELDMLNSQPDVYKTKTLNFLNTPGAKRIQYTQVSERIVNFQLPEGKILEAISIETEEFSPFGPGYIEYFIVADGNEYPITPTNQDGDHPEFYHYNSALSADERELSIGQGFIYTETVRDVSIKVKLSRPSASTYTTPMVTAIRCNQIRSDEL